MKKKTLFVDTGAWYALADRSDQHHGKAVKSYPQLLKRYRHLTTTNLVIAETYILIRRGLGYQAGMRFLESISASPRVMKIYSDGALEDSAQEFLRKYDDQDFSYTDAVSFSVMQSAGIAKAFAFDKHFVTAGFKLVP